MSSETPEQEQQTSAVAAGPATGRKEWKVRRSFNSDMSMHMIHRRAIVVQTWHYLSLLYVLPVRHRGTPHPQRGSEESLERVPGREPLVQRWDLVGCYIWLSFLFYDKPANWVWKVTFDCPFSRSTAYFFCMVGISWARLIHQLLPSQRLCLHLELQCNPGASQTALRWSWSCRDGKQHKPLYVPCFHCGKIILLANSILFHSTLGWIRCKSATSSKRATY